jgi:hypothetical protein
MADKKISALTSASTPLAGTEVLPIVQSSTTVKVSAANITAGRAVSTLSVASLGPNGIPITMQEITAAPSSATAAYVGVTTSAFPGGANGDLVLIPRSSSTNDVRILVGSGTPTDALVVQGSTKNILASAGNVVMSTAGKGIDFSANTGTAGMTSEVLTWYEEGVFTATLTCTSGTITLNSGQDLMQYTRIGRMVYVSGQIVVSAISSPTGILTLGGLPFTVNGSLGELAGRGAITVVAEGVGITVNNVVGYFLTGGTTANIYKYAAGNTANMAADVTASSSFLINMWYVAA